VRRAGHDLLALEDAVLDQSTVRWLVTPSIVAGSAIVSHSPPASADREAWMRCTRRSQPIRCAVQVFP
jgi:hypothetical protein